MDRTGFVANKPFTMKNVSYKPGDPVDLRELADHKISQFLNQRLIRPGMAERDAKKEDTPST